MVMFYCRTFLSRTSKLQVLLWIGIQLLSMSGKKRNNSTFHGCFYSFFFLIWVLRTFKIILLILSTWGKIGRAMRKQPYHPQAEPDPSWAWICSGEMTSDLERLRSAVLTTLPQGPPNLHSLLLHIWPTFTVPIFRNYFTFAVDS